jgi:hypothetical protein
MYPTRIWTCRTSTSATITGDGPLDRGAWSYRQRRLSVRRCGHTSWTRKPLAVQREQQAWRPALGADDEQGQHRGGRVHGQFECGYCGESLVVQIRPGRRTRLACRGPCPWGTTGGSRVEADVSPAVEVLAARVGRTGAALRGCVDAFAATARRNTNGPPDALTSRWGTLVRHGRLRNLPAGDRWPCSRGPARRALVVTARPALPGNRRVEPPVCLGKRCPSFVRDRPRRDDRLNSAARRCAMAYGHH